MGTPPTVDTLLEAQIDWEAARTRTMARIRAELPGWGRERIEDLAHEALIQLLRVVRREGIRNLDGLLGQVAKTTVIDAIRREQRRRARFSEVGEDLPEVPAPPVGPDDELADPLERLRFVVLEHFRRHDTACGGLALAFFSDEDWKTVAEGLGRTYDAVRQQWSRCVRALRAALASEAGPLFDWITENE